MFLIDIGNGVTADSCGVERLRFSAGLSKSLQNRLTTQNSYLTPNTVITLNQMLKSKMCFWRFFSIHG